MFRNMRGRALAVAVLIALVVAVVAPQAATSAPKVSNPLAIGVTSSPSPVVSGTELTYTITVNNNGGAAIDQVVTTDQVNGLTGIDGTNNLILSSNVGTCSQSANAGGMLVRCDHGTMAGFQVATVTIRGKVTAAAGTVLNNTATTTATKSAQTVSATAGVTTQVTGGTGPLADLTISATSPLTTPPGSDYFTTLTVNNTGSLNTTDVRLTATIPAGTATYSTADATSLFACNPDPQVDGSTLVVCTGGAVNAGANAIIKIYMVAPAANDVTTTVSAQVDPLNTVPESSDLNNSAQASTKTSTTPPANTLSITKGAPNEVIQYDLMTYTVTVTNSSNWRADYVTATDGTQGLDAASVSVNVTSAPASPGVTCSVAAPLVRCDTTRLAAGNSFTFTVTGRVIASPGSFIINTASVNGNIRNTGHSATATAVTTVRPGIELSVTQYRTAPALPAPVRAAAQFDYTITVGNSGLKNAMNVLVREPLPAGVLLDGFDASRPGTTCSPAVPPATGGVVECTIPQVDGALAGGGGTTETITLHLIAPHAIGPITSTVTVDPLNQIAEPDESNNTFVTTTQVETGIDLTIDKVDNFDPIARNGTLQYTITVPNLGTQDTSAVVVRDVLPSGAVFRSASGDHNFTCGHANGIVTCTGGIIRGTWSGSLTLPVDVATITIDLFAPDEPGLAHNEVRVDPDNAIPEIIESNNIDFEDTVVENGQANGAYKELSIPDITDNHDPIATSGTLDYTLTVLNTGSADAFNVVVKAALPAGAIYRTANDTILGSGAFTCAENAGVVTCTGGTVLKASGTRQILISTFARPTPGTSILTATVDPANAIGEANESNNQTDESTVVQAGGPAAYIDLHVADIVDNFDPIAPAGTLNYDVTIENLGSADAFGVSFRATLPTGSTFRFADDQANDPLAFSCTEAGLVVNCTTARINAGGAARTVRIGVFAPNQPGTARLDVSIDVDNAIAEGDESNNTAEEFTAVQLGGGGGFIDLQVAKAGPDDVAPGETFNYTVTVSNAGSDDAFNVAVRDPLPAGTTFVSANGDGGFVCVQAGGVVDCTGGYVPGNGGAARTITIRVKAPLVHDPANPIRNQVFVDPANAIAESNETNNSAFKDTTVTSKVDLQIEVADASISTGSDGHWNVTAKNTGTAAASNVTFEFNVGVGVIILDVNAPAGWSCTTNENPVNKVTCTTASLAAGAAPVIAVHAYKTAEGTVNGNAVIDPANTVVETNESNNTDSGTA